MEVATPRVDPFGYRLGFARSHPASVEQRLGLLTAATQHVSWVETLTRLRADGTVPSWPLQGRTFRGPCVHGLTLLRPGRSVEQVREPRHP